MPNSTYEHQHHMQIRLATFADLTRITALDKQSSLTPWSYDNYLSSLNNSKHTIYLLADNNDIIGAAVIAEAADEAELLQLWIKPDGQRHGYGRKLLKDILAKLQQHLINQIFLEVRTDNQAAIGLYTNLGFNSVGIRKNYYTVDSWQFDALIMTRNI